MEGRRRTCPLCECDLVAVLVPSDHPDFWVRAGRVQGRWSYTSQRPTREERPSALGYRCTSCEASFRVILPT